MGSYALIYVGATMMALVTTPIMVWIARTLNIMDQPGVRKVHASAIPRIGGAAIVLALAGIAIISILWGNFLGQALLEAEPRVLVMLAAALFMFVVGLIDDICDLRARLKLLAQILAAVAVCWVGIRVESIEFGESFVLNFGWLSWPITILWIVGVTNAVNLIDGLDGLAAGIAAVTCGVIAVFSIYTNQLMMSMLMVGLLGSLTGFLFFNFNPAKIFMGDCGTMFLGFILGASSVLCAVKSATLVGLALPAVAMGIPILDMLFCMIRRVLERRSIFSADRSHVHHRLLDMGIHHRHVVILIYVVTLLSAGLGVIMMFTRDAGTIVVFACVLALLIGLFRFVGAVRIRESIVVFSRNVTLARKQKADQILFDRFNLQMREVSDLQAWWQIVCDLAEKMEFVWLTLDVTNRNGSQNVLVWRSAVSTLSEHEIVSMTLPIQDRRAGPPVRMEFGVNVNGSLEIAGRRIAGLSRLIDEYSLAKIPKSDCSPSKNYTIINRKRDVSKHFSYAQTQRGMQLQRV